MKGRLALGAIVTLLAAGFAVPAAATDGAVTFRFANYTPSLIRITPGGAVTFTPDAGNTFADHPLMFVGTGAPYASSGSSAPPKVFAAAGIYRFYCTHHGFANTDGSVGGMSGQVVVTANQPPAASFTMSPSPATAGQTVTLDAGSSTDDHGIVSYRWDFDNDGRIDETDTQPATTHVFAASATVALTVVDDNADAVGPESAATTRTLSVIPPPPAPGGGDPPAPAPDRVAPRAALVTRSLHLADLRGGRAKLTFTSTEPGSATATVKAGPTTIATGKLVFTSPSRHSLTLKLTAVGKARLRHARRAALRVSLIVSDAAGNHAAAKTLALPHVT